MLTRRLRAAVSSKEPPSSRSFCISAGLTAQALMPSDVAYPLHKRKPCNAATTITRSGQQVLQGQPGVVMSLDQGSSAATVTLQIGYNVECHFYLALYTHMYARLNTWPCIFIGVVQMELFVDIELFGHKTAHGTVISFSNENQ